MKRPWVRTIAGGVLVGLCAAGMAAPWAEGEMPSAPRSETGHEVPWGLSAEILEQLAQKAEVYREYALRFTCAENVRIARYDSSAEATSESTRRFAYLLERDANGETLREFRQTLKAGRGGREEIGREVQDEERFPPAYAWVFLFSRFNQSYFAYRDLGDRFEGFDWVHEIEFRGALPFTDGKDVRQWNGTALVDAVTLVPVEIRAEPTAQKERIRALFDQWTQAFNLLGWRLAPRPFGYRCRVSFGLRRDRLAFPTELRYDTFRAQGPRDFIPWMASVRVYEDYRFYQTSATETEGTPLSR